jgi:hypothetical protein
MQTMAQTTQTHDLFELFIDGLADAIAARMRGGAAPSSTKPAAAMRGAKRRKGQKRSSDDLAGLTSSLLGYIKANPGERIEQIARGLRVSTIDLKLPAQKLIAGKDVKTKGQRRGTHYFAA